MSTVRFNTYLRGQLVDVEMEIISLDPPQFTVVFRDGWKPGDKLTREEIATLCRLASVYAKDEPL